jgi:cytochrome c-type biogenesis protein CcmF
METSGTALSGYTIYLALAAGILSTGLYLLALLKKKAIPAARYAYYTSALFITLAMVFLTYHLVSRDFRISYVAAYSSSDLSLLYTISALWAGQEGSFLFWTFCSLLLGLFLLRKLGDLEDLVMFFYNLPVVALLVLLFKQSPFLTLAQPMADGKGLNPLLQNPWMAIHPPAMFVGYAAYGIPFALVLALAVRKEFHRFIPNAHAWVLFAWVSMGFGIILGGFWAYETLGWGGFWGWDPVENASLIPWLTLSALLHGMVVQRRFKGFFKSNYLLVVVSFLFILYGTFLTRSGVLQDFSVHSFVDLGITGLLLVVLGFFTLLGLGVLIVAWKGFPKGEKIHPGLNAPFFLTLSALLLLASAFFVTLGTSSPILTKFFGNPSKVGNDFYVLTSIPVYLLLMAIMAVCPLFYIAAKRRTVFLFGGLSLGVTLLSAALGVHNILHLLILFVCAFALINQWLWIRKMEIAFIHAGLALFIMGSVYSTGYATKEKLALTEGQPATWSGHAITLRGFETPADGRSRLKLDLVKGGKGRPAAPRFWENPKTQQMVANPDIQKGLFSDVYLAVEQYQPPSAGGNEMVFAKGQTQEVGPFDLTFTGFQFTGGSHAQGGPMDLACVFLVTDGDKTWQVEPKLFMTAVPEGSSAVRLKEGSPWTVRVNRVNAESKQVKILVGNGGEGKATAVLEAMHIPMINLVWLGTILALAGGVWSLVRQARRRSAYMQD